MALLNEIIEWAQGLKRWQQEALRRIFFNPQLSPADVDIILQLVRSEENGGVAPSEQSLFKTEDLPGIGSGSTVRLVKLSELTQINGFPTGRAFDLPPDGMTIFFGHNGAGKSGYARVLKNACKARHRTDVLPNAFAATSGTPSAQFEILVDGQSQVVPWSQGGSVHPHLSSVAVYDVACAHDYIDVEGVPAFQPYGLVHLTRLALLQRELQTRFATERTALNLAAHQFDELKGDTEVGRHIEKIGHSSDVEAISLLGTFTDAEAERLAFIKRTLLETDPAPKALLFDRLATRLEQAQQLAANVQRWVNDRAVVRARELIDAEKTANAAMSVARAQLQGISAHVGPTLAPSTQVTTLLEGTGNALWQALYRAAEAFSHQSAYRGHAFPHLEADGQCVLCQQKYSADASTRMERFATFVKDRSTADAEVATKARREALSKVSAIDLTILDAPTMADVAEQLPELSTPLVQAESVWRTRHRWLLQVLGSGNWEEPPPDLPADVSLDETLTEGTGTLRARAKTLRASADPVVRQTLIKEMAELEARFRLVSHMPALRRFIADSITYQDLTKCHSALNPQPVSRKITALAGKYVTDALEAATNAELAALGYRRKVRAELAGRTDLGMTKVALRLSDITLKATRVLSEGEQRAMGLAMFLAELEAQSHTSAVVFDDPSTSFDHHFRRAIAMRLVSLAEKRQVLVFTHDAVFLTELAMALRHVERSACYKTIGWDHAPGLVSEGLTWATKDTKARLLELRQQANSLKNCQTDYQSEENNRKIAAGYSSLRGTIERAIREVFLNNTVQPFSDVVSVDSFGAVIGHPPDEWESLQAAYGRACEAIEAHDTPGERLLPLPTGQELSEDIALVIDLVERAVVRRKAYDAQRSVQNAQRKKLFS